MSSQSEYLEALEEVYKLVGEALGYLDPEDETDEEEDDEQ